MNTSNVKNLVVQMCVEAHPMDDKDTKILITCINAEARIESARIVADAIDKQGRNISMSMVTIAKALNRIAKHT